MKVQQCFNKSIEDLITGAAAINIPIITENRPSVLHMLQDVSSFVTKDQIEVSAISLSGLIKMFRVIEGPSSNAVETLTSLKSAFPPPIFNRPGAPHEPTLYDRLSSGSPRFRPQLVSNDDDLPTELPQMTLTAEEFSKPYSLPWKAMPKALRNMVNQFTKWETSPVQTER